jgi:hypothetical protein
LQRRHRRVKKLALLLIDMQCEVRLGSFQIQIRPRVGKLIKCGVVVADKGRGTSFILRSRFRLSMNYAVLDELPNTETTVPHYHLQMTCHHYC